MAQIFKLTVERFLLHYLYVHEEPLDLLRAYICVLVAQSRGYEDTPQQLRFDLQTNVLEIAVGFSLSAFLEARLATLDTFEEVTKALRNTRDIYERLGITESGRLFSSSGYHNMFLHDTHSTTSPIVHEGKGMVDRAIQDTPLVSLRILLEVVHRNLDLRHQLEQLHAENMELREDAVSMTRQELACAKTAVVASERIRQACRDALCASEDLVTFKLRLATLLDPLDVPCAIKKSDMACAQSVPLGFVLYDAIVVTICGFRPKPLVFRVRLLASLEGKKRLEVLGGLKTQWTCVTTAADLDLC